MMWFIIVTLEQKDQDQNFVMIYLKDNRLYICHELERILLLSNSCLYSINLWFSFRYYVRMSSKHNYLLISATLLSITEFLKFFYEFIECFQVVQMMQIVSIFFVIGSQCHLTKREKILLTLYE